MVRDPGEDGGVPAATPLVLFLVRPRPQAMRAAWLAGALAVATLVTALRLEMGLSSSGVPLVFYLPAVIAVTLVAGWEYGAASLIASVALVWFVFVPPAYTFGPMSRSQTVTLALWAVVSVLMVALAHYLRESLISSLRNESRYRRLASLISDIVWMTDGDGNVREPNAAWSRVTGMQWPDYGGRKWANAVHEDDRGQLMPPDGSAHAHGRVPAARCGKRRLALVSEPRGGVARHGRRRRGMDHRAARHPRIQTRQGTQTS